MLGGQLPGLIYEQNYGNHILWPVHNSMYLSESLLIQNTLKDK